MQAFVTLVRRELGGYFISWTGYVLITSVLLLLGLSFLDIFAKLSSQPTEAPITEQFFLTFYFWLILLLTSPVMTMRTFALEKFSGTYETLMTAPVRDLEVVLAKFTGALLFYALTWLPLLAYLLVVRHYSSDPSVLDPRVLASTYLGLILIGALYMSVGCFASALTQSQIIAAMISYAIGLALFLLSLRSLMSAPPTGWVTDLFQYISMTDHMQDFARGVVDTRCLIYYGSFTTLFLFLTVKVVEARRWK